MRQGEKRGRQAPGGVPLRPGVTLVELIVALAIFSVLLTTTLAFYRQQGEAFSEGNDRMAVMQNLRYGVNIVDQNVRTAGIGVPTEQPVIVYADDDVIAFNADFATNTSNDFFSVFYDYRLPDDAVSAVTQNRAFTIPNTSFTYPDTSYYQGSGNSPAETITLFFQADTSTARTDDYVLYRQVNDQTAEVVARRLLTTGGPFFTYYKVVGGSNPIQAIASTALPAAHSVATHGSMADTGAVALVDSIRAVRLTYAATNGLSGSDENMREISRLIRLPNAAIETQPNCGNKPILGTTLSVTGVKPTESEAGHILLQWTRATDEYTGEQDILRYVIWRQDGHPDKPWGDPLVSISPGSSTYTYQDFTAVDDKKYSYALAAMDCTPQYSEPSVTNEVEWKSP